MGKTVDLERTATLNTRQRKLKLTLDQVEVEVADPEVVSPCLCRVDRDTATPMYCCFATHLLCDICLCRGCVSRPGRSFLLLRRRRLQRHETN